MAKIALVIGATQSLGLAVIELLAAQMTEDDIVYLTGRDAGRLAGALAKINASRAQVRIEVIDVGDASSIDRVASKVLKCHGGVDIVFSNAYSPLSPDDKPSDIITRYVNVINLGTTRVLRRFAPLLRDGGRLLVVASALGTLQYLAPILHKRFDGLRSLDEVDRQVCRWRDAVCDGSAMTQGWPAFIKIPSMIAQVAAVRTLACSRRREDVRRNILIAAVCPGIVDTGASSPWFDMSRARTPLEAAQPLVDLALLPTPDARLYGSLVRSGDVLPWAPWRQQSGKKDWPMSNSTYAQGC